ncbi:MAG: CotH kinase family protein [Labilithrix sp.]|nr:CotH kinase family protein [Labilithrix sp.]
MIIARFPSRSKTLFTLAALAGALAAGACSDDAAASREAARSRTRGAEDPAASEAESGPSDAVVDAAAGRAVYDPEVIPKVALELDAAAMATLSNADAVAKKTWVHGRLTVGAVTFDDVGVRIKGTSTLRLPPAKPSLKIKLSKWVKGQRLDGLDELTLHNMVSDPTCLAERLSYHVFRAMGLPASRANTAELSINGESYGIVANVETPNKRFLARAFGGRARTLYEINWGGGWLPGGDVTFEVDVADPTAAPGTAPDLERLFATVAAARDETLLADLKPRLDTTEWLRHSAAEAVTGHEDGYAYGRWGSHNYFLAGDVDGRFALIPWSTDLSLSDSDGVANAAEPLASTVLARCKRSACWDAYLTEVKAALSVYESLDLVALAHRWHDRIDPLVRADPKREPDIEIYDAATAALFAWLAARPSVIREQLGL